MKIGIMQPTYLPWLGYFELMARCDQFVFLDDVQFNKKSWQQRNRIKGPNGELLMTVPVLNKGKREQAICEVCVNNNDRDWGKKHQRSIESSYQKAPFFDWLYTDLCDVYQRPWIKLVDLNLALLGLLQQRLGIVTPTLRSSSLSIEVQGNQRVIEICRRLGAHELYDAAGAVDFIDDTVPGAGITVVYQDYHHPFYSQLHGAFVPYLSVLDVLFNEGPKSLEILLSGTAQGNERKNP